MSAKKYRVRLSPEEQMELKALASKGRTAAYRQTHARILLACDEAQEDGSATDAEIASVLKVGVSTVTRVRRRCVEEGLEAATGPQEASATATEAPGRRGASASGSPRLRQTAAGPGEVDDQAAGATLGGVRDRRDRRAGDGAAGAEKNALKSWLKVCWCIPPQANADFVCAMEDVLEAYQRDYGEDEVLVCMDLTSRQQVRESRASRPVQPGAPAIYDYEYERCGVSNLFMLFAPLEGWRRVEVTERRTKADWAALIKSLVDEDYPDKRVVLVMDNLEHARPRLPVRGVRASRGAADCRAPGDSLHTQAR